MNLDERCRRVGLILTDVDGVLTDGGIIFDNQGIESKRFHIRDGLGIRLWQRAGYGFGILTARTSRIVQMRATELDIQHVRQGVEDKLAAARKLLDDLKLSPEQLCYVGDDLTDLRVIKFAGLGVAVADAVAEVVQAADHVTAAGGGQGALRELIELLLKSRHRWDDLIRPWTDD